MIEAGRGRGGLRRERDVTGDGGLGMRDGGVRKAARPMQGGARRG